MSFETDKQTLDDLNILGKYKTNSIFSLFSNVATRGGLRVLEEMFIHPLTDAQAINKRISIFKYFWKHETPFPEEAENHDLVDQYLSNASGQNWLYSLGMLSKERLMALIGNDPHFKLLQDQMQASLKFLKDARQILLNMKKNIAGNPLEEKVTWALALLENKSISTLLNEREGKLSFISMFHTEKVLRTTFHKEMAQLMSFFYEMDVYNTVGKAARDLGLCFPIAQQESDISINIKGLHHPALRDAISNDLCITKEKNIFFLTGANMAGKSTLMKSFGIAVYMAHMGFPVAAEEMQFTIQDGMYTSINVPDNIHLGYSHFYAEVLRVKHVAEEVSKNKKLVVIFDELFKGTNVKDAYDATLAVTEALTTRKACSFMISTHIIEVGQALEKRCKNVIFEYLPTVMNGKVPTYTYRLTPGITADKHGMIIINNEQIIDILKEAGKIKSNSKNTIHEKNH